MLTQADRAAERRRVKLGVHTDARRESVPARVGHPVYSVTEFS